MPETIGQQLKQTRESKGLTIQKVVQATHIRAPHLEALEADDFESLPSPVQARAFLRLYAEYLGISLDQIVTRQSASIDVTSSEEQIPTPPPLEKEVDSVVNGSAQTRKSPDWVKLKLPFNLGAKKNSHPKPQNIVPIPDRQVDQSISHDQTDKIIDGNPAHSDAYQAPPEEISQSQVILNSIGKTLRQRRESLSLTPEEIERQTHIRKNYLLALEHGEFYLLPSSVQTRGILHNYARFLDLDSDTLLLRYADSLQIQRLERQTAEDQTTPQLKTRASAGSAQPAGMIAALRRYLSIDILVGGGLILLLLVFAIWGTSRIINLRSESTSQPTAQSISSILRSSPESELAAPSLVTTGVVGILPPATETLIVTLPATSQGAVNVVVVAENQAWVRVSVDGIVQFEGRVTAGKAYPYVGNTQIEVLTGNGIAVNIIYNQSNLGPMGGLGEVVDRIYTSKTILVPTATFTPSPTITPTPTRTLRPSATLRPSPTPRKSSTPVR